jgi:hypothetical protein
MNTNQQKGFIAPLLIIMVAVVAIGVGFYAYKLKSEPAAVVASLHANTAVVSAIPVASSADTSCNLNGSPIAQILPQDQAAINALNAQISAVQADILSLLKEKNDFILVYGWAQGSMNFEETGGGDKLIADATKLGQLQAQLQAAEAKALKDFAAAISCAGFTIPSTSQPLNLTN